RLDQDTSGILTTICNHSFHCSCISKWADSSCPLGFLDQFDSRYAAIANSKLKNLYVSFVKPRRTFGYVLYVGLLAVEDNYVHRLIQSKTDGKLVELNSHCMHADSGCGSCGDNAMREAILNSKVEAIVSEYNELLATQLENQKLYFESLLQQVEQETEGKISVAVQKAVSLKQQKIQSKIDRCNKEKKFLDELNDNLLKNEEIWKAKILEIEERYGFIHSLLLIVIGDMFSQNNVLFKMSLVP
ncbi:ubiquitin carboxyl-terminal hydrolase, partial [Trifolium medium]|nr:ubiquitin carboxyl-terminal hydrolase [Trifolium medium]